MTRSPEYSSGFRRHIRREKEKTRRSAAIIQPSRRFETENPADLHWNTIQTIITNSLNDNRDMIRLFKGNKLFFREFYDGRREKTLTGKSDNFERLQYEHLEDSSSPKYDPEFFDQAGPILKIITAETDKLRKR